MPYTASLLWTRLTSHGKLYSMFCPQTFHVRETSPGKNKIFLSMCLPHLLQAIPGSIGTSTCSAALSLLTALYVISVRQTGDLPTPSFRFRLTTDTLGVQLYPSHYRAGSGLSPIRFCPCRAHKWKGVVFHDTLGCVGICMEWNVAVWGGGGRSLMRRRKNDCLK